MTDDENEVNTPDDEDLDLYDDDENFSKSIRIKRHGRRFDDNTSKNKNY